ncbi:hypothetical protein Q5H92_08930 [Hymenobacter sp. M29]|uniref:Uncharacterized protein n=1 Tax=Hymenobacter mellowenesis TaxID=3063995 RepID=A0ABT9A9F8_9BACT|nr:hypothetical protein [Hymenobacter sp. M29]MDO7846479.1 hypothetical protein [Hymenobacter sp. M29]
MRDILLYLNGRRADLPPNLKGLFRLNKEGSLGDLAVRLGEYSLPISLPATRGNLRIFGVNANHVLAIDKFRTVDYPFELRCDGEVLLGTFRLTAISAAAYTGTLLVAGYSWAQLLVDKKLTDLQFDAISYNGTQLETILGQSCDATDVQFPLCSFGNFFHPPAEETQPDGSKKEVSLPAQALFSWPMAVDDYAPGVYYPNVLRQIFKDIGWNLTGRVLDEARWRETVLTSAGADLSKAWPWGALLPASGASTGGGQYSYVDAGPGNGYENTIIGLDENAPAGNILGYDMGGEVMFLPVPVRVQTGGTRALDGENSVYLAQQAGTHTFAYSVGIQNGHQTIRVDVPVAGAFHTAFAPVLLGLLVRRGGGGFDGSPVNGSPIDPQVLPAYNALTFDNRGEVVPGTKVGTASVYLEVGDVVQLCLITRRRLTDLPTQATFLTRAEFVINFSASSFACTAFDGPTMLQPANFLPPLLQRDVVRDFLLRTDTVPVADANRRTVRLLTRDELSATAGEVLDLTGLLDPEAMEYLPAAGATVGAVVFSAAENPDEPLPVAADVVRVVTGPGVNEQAVGSLFAPVAFRSYQTPQPGNYGQRIDLPTFATEDALAQNLDETDWDASSQAPRLVRYTGPDATLTVPFQQRRVPLAGAAWDGPLRWAGPTGAVATYYARTVQRLTRGHVGKVPASLTPALYRALSIGRQVTISGALYTLEKISSYDLADDAATAPLELLRDL